jgi:hypothetical protein
LNELDRLLAKILFGNFPEVTLEKVEEEMKW